MAQENRGAVYFNIGEIQVSTARSDAGGDTPTFFEVSESLLNANFTGEGVQYAIENGNWSDDDRLGGKMCLPRGLTLKALP